MKTLKLDHKLAEEIAAGKRTSTWRVNDDKDIHVNDDVQLIDKVDPLKPETWQIIGIAHIVSVMEKQIGQVSQADMTDGEKFTSTEDILKILRGYYGEQVLAETPVKIIIFTFTKSVAATSAIPTGQKELKMFADGGSRGNPGPSASGFVLYDMEDKIIAENGLFLGVTTNNQAEYHALRIGMEAALRHGATILHVFMDSMLVVNQMKGIFKVSNRDLQAINRELQEIAKKFTKITYQHVPRERNKAADAIVNQVLDTSK